ncbi:hypothetical protein [Komagataeibacter oboediens]|uniref:Phage tail protein n=1 Tax=Komagataeibacter oboediens TaxID=65958 RepID=A0ABS5SRK9_9PROT|nr:hypothetical protein [Komagataeibacter oboediens]MBL7234721.1 hypothetical protein [Komagataeibacter oboediens]MBT0676100.1 hypothetical protein [Komagataeibacter oboediens]MBT0680156.1 hypothetical protein [Komagataeibacter oboediens]
MADVTQNGFALRIRRLLPTGWFPSAPAAGEAEQAPVLNALLQGFGSVFTWIWAMLSGTADQTRLATMSGAFLDMFAADFFGTMLTRNPGESDDAFRARIEEALFPSLGTRPDVVNVIADEVGQAGRVIEPRNAADCKGIASMASPAIGGGYGYGVAALRYGSRGAPFQLFAQLPTGDTSQPATQTLDRIADVMPAGTIAWVQDVETPE